MPSNDISSVHKTKRCKRVKKSCIKRLDSRRTLGKWVREHWRVGLLTSLGSGIFIRDDFSGITNAEASVWCEEDRICTTNAECRGDAMLFLAALLDQNHETTSYYHLLLSDA